MHFNRLEPKYISDTNSIVDLNPKECCSCLESKRGLTAADQPAQTFCQLSARAAVNSLVKSDRRLHHFSGPLIRLNPRKSSAWLNEHVPPVALERIKKKPRHRNNVGPRGIRQLCFGKHQILRILQSSNFFIFANLKTYRTRVIVRT